MAYVITYLDRYDIITYAINCRATIAKLIYTLWQSQN